MSNTEQNTKSANLVAIEENEICKKMTLKEALGEQECIVYTDKRGFSRVKQPSITHVYTTDNYSLSSSCVFTKKGSGESAEYEDISGFSFTQIADIFKCKLYGNFQGRYYPDKYIPERYERQLEVVAVDVELPLGDEMKLTKDNIKEYNQYLAQPVWKMKSGNNASLTNLATLRMGDLICYEEKGTYKIVERFPPRDDSSSVLFKAVSVVDGSEISINMYGFGTKESSNRSKIYQVPYWEYAGWSRLFEIKNKLLLSPYLEWDGNTYSLYWLHVDDAARYVVTIRKTVMVNDFYRPLYELQNIEVDRNVHYVTIDKLLGSRYTFWIAAEDREGNVIAKTYIRQGNHV